MEEIARWQLAFWQRRAEVASARPWGAVALTPSLPAAHDHNKVVVCAPVEAGALIRDTDRALFSYDHRRIEVLSSTLADELEPGLVAAGYARDDDLVMLHTAAPPARGTGAVLTLAQRIEAARSGWEQEQPDWDPRVWDQLGRRAATAAGACAATFLAVRDESGTVVARADLFVHDQVAQVEEVMTDPASRGRGHASLLVLDAAARARAAGATTVFLVADAQDWPQQLYRRLGFTDLGRTATFTR